MLNVGTIWINSFPIEKGVQTRKQSGNYEINGFRVSFNVFFTNHFCLLTAFFKIFSKSLRNFLKPKYETLNSVQFVDKDFEQMSKKLKSFGGLDPTPTLPTAQNLNVKKTYKLYVGGRQTRPDTQSSRILYANDKHSTPYCLLADASRKDVRNAVEAAQGAFPAWWKRSNFNKAQIIYYFGENFTARSAELSHKLEEFTGNSKADCDKEIRMCADVIFYFASLCDKYVGRLNVGINLITLDFFQLLNTKRIFSRTQLIMDI